jgi:hypothetical protein
MAGAAALAVAAAVALLLLAWRDPQRRAWALLTVASAVGYFALRELPPLARIGAVGRPDWNWSGHLLALAGTLLLAAMLVRRAGLQPRDFGFARPTNLGLGVAVCASVLLLSGMMQVVTGGRREPMPAGTWLFIAVAPGLVEETAFRGVLLATAERAAPAARRVAGVSISIGATLLTMVFVVLHGFGIGLLVSVLPGALLYLWLRLKTGSVLLPVIAHNLWNLTVLATHVEPPH